MRAKNEYEAARDALMQYCEKATDYVCEVKESAYPLKVVFTPNEADAHFGCKRLSARIWDLIHKDGYNIKCKIEHGKNKHGAKCSYARYYIERGAT